MEGWVTPGPLLFTLKHSKAMKKHPSIFWKMTVVENSHANGGRKFLCRLESGRVIQLVDKGKETITAGLVIDLLPGDCIEVAITQLLFRLQSTDMIDADMFSLKFVGSAARFIVDGLPMYTVDGSEQLFSLRDIARENPDMPLADLHTIASLKPGESTNAFHEAQVTRIS